MTGNTDIDIGQQFPSSRFDTFLTNGVTLAIFHSFGNVSASIQLLKMYAKDSPTILLKNVQEFTGNFI